MVRAVKNWGEYNTIGEVRQGIVSKSKTSARLETASLVHTFYTTTTPLSMVRAGLTQHGQCDVPVNSANAIRLRLLGTPAPLTPIKSYMVPVILDPGN